MALFKHMALSALLLVFLPSACLATDLNNLNETICDAVECGKGKCVSNARAPFAFICECDAGWKRTRLENEDNVKYLPCVIPNCSIEYSCMPAPAPLPPVPYNVSFFDPCYWAYCGGGTCTKSSNYEHTCQCNPGYSNLMNITVFPCYNACAIGSDCSKLGIKVADSTSTPGSSDSHAPTSLPGKLLWMAGVATSMALVLWKKPYSSQLEDDGHHHRSDTYPQETIFEMEAILICWLVFEDCKTTLAKICNFKNSAKFISLHANLSKLIKGFQSSCVRSRTQEKHGRIERAHVRKRFLQAHASPKAKVAARNPSPAGGCGVDDDAFEIKDSRPDCEGESDMNWSWTNNANGSACNNDNNISSSQIVVNPPAFDAGAASIPINSEEYQAFLKRKLDMAYAAVAMSRVLFLSLSL
ncbi:hypothetical protein SAY86_024783 [Trapa natans]|uniref:Uncharacterized protein n=1 Tax=Trapa natans TaxID=22666 RepID=A0AAN7MVH9_TRANT|nr:hypothetical protein SAY86_024783 [Trapa natans]